MKRTIWLTILMLSAEGALVAQDLPKDVKRSVDTFTGDTVWETKYGRLDNPQGCGRSDLAIVWQLTRGPSGRAETLQVQYDDVQTPFHRVRSLGMTAAVINVDGHFFDAPLRPLSSQHRYNGPVLGVEAQHVDTTKLSSVEERATFLLPDSTFRRVAEAKVAKIRIRGGERTCDGTVEQNMVDRLHSLLSATDTSQANK